jgi:hypothetical protein
MTSDPARILIWLCAHTQRDRVVQNALNNLPRSMEIRPAIFGNWGVDVVSRRGVAYQLIVVCDVVGEPVRWFRIKEGE